MGITTAGRAEAAVAVEATRKLVEMAARMEAMENHNMGIRTAQDKEAQPVSLPKRLERCTQVAAVAAQMGLVVPGAEQVKAPVLRRTQAVAAVGTAGRAVRGL